MHFELDILTKDLLAKGARQLEKNEAGKFGYAHLELRGYNIKTLDGDLKNYTALRFIDLSHNSIESLDGLKTLTKLHAINFKSNSVLELPDFSSHGDLQIVELDDNRIRGLHNFRLLHVKALTLSRNKIASLNPLSLVEKLPLQVLDLSYNEISHTMGVESLKNLQILNLRGNKLAELGGIAQLSSLRQLDVRENHLPGLDSLKPLAQATKLQYLATKGNAGIHPEGTDDDALVPEILLRVPQLLRWNDLEFTEDHRLAATNLKNEREAESAARAAEAAAAATVAAEAAAAEGAGGPEEGAGEDD